MKRFLTIVLFLSLSIDAFSCGWYEPEYDYFNLFMQDIIQDKTYYPFLLTYDYGFYDKYNEAGVDIPNENIEAWQAYFDNKLSYEETKDLVYNVPMSDLNDLKFKRPQSNELLSRLGVQFYQNYQEGIDYLIEAKYLQPYMTVAPSRDEDSTYFYSDDDRLTVADLDEEKITNDLESLYNAAVDTRIKLRYAYQLTRFNHYLRNYEAAEEAFYNYAEPLGLKNVVYYLALEQVAGAQKGLGKDDEANWNFFQVFTNARNRKKVAYRSMSFGEMDSFNHLLDRAQTDDERIMAYFVLGYQNFNNPLPMMEQIYKINPNSEALKVLQARTINELERNLLTKTYNEVTVTEKPNQSVSNVTSHQQFTKESAPKQSFVQKIISFFKNLFKKKKEATVEQAQPTAPIVKAPVVKRSNQQRLPDMNYVGQYEEDETALIKEHLQNVQELTNKIRERSDDEFWNLSYAYLKFLAQDYTASNQVLNTIDTDNEEYAAQIEVMQMLNEIVAQPVIDKAFEETLITKYGTLFEQEKSEEYGKPTAQDFVIDILANRYFLQGEDGKSFLMNNNLKTLLSSPNPEITRKLEAFYLKADKSTFEEKVIMRNFEVKDSKAFFNLIYGDDAIRSGSFKAAVEYYRNIPKKSDFLYRGQKEWNSETNEYAFVLAPQGTYDLFNNVSSLVFGRNKFVSYYSKEERIMQPEPFVNEFKFIKDKMTKFELAEALLKLQEIGAGNNQRASKANQLIGNVLYNTSLIGYYRHLFVLDKDNSCNSQKFSIQTPTHIEHKYYYKTYAWNSFVKQDQFDLPMHYYKKALEEAKNEERKAEITFQLARVEKGQYYQWVASQPGVSYSDYEDYDEYSYQVDHYESQLIDRENRQFRTYFNLLKEQYADTEAVKEIKSNCTQFYYFMQQ